MCFAHCHADCSIPENTCYYHDCNIRHIHSSAALLADLQMGCMLLVCVADWEGPPRTTLALASWGGVRVL